MPAGTPLRVVSWNVRASMTDRVLDELCSDQTVDLFVLSEYRIPRHRSAHLLIAGDFNSCFPHEADSGRGYTIAPLTRMAATAVDLWRAAVRDPGERDQITWAGPNGKGNRLDFVFGTPGIASMVTAAAHRHAIREQGISRSCSGRHRSPGACGSRGSTTRSPHIPLCRSHMTTTWESNRTRIPHVGVGCIVVRDGRLLLVRSHSGYWSTPGGHLEFGESPAECAARETVEETGVRASNIDFVAITNDVMMEPEKHYITIWMRADADESTPVIGDPDEVSAVEWFAPDALPAPLFPFFENLLSGRSWPSAPANMPFATRARTSATPPAL